MTGGAGVVRSAQSLAAAAETVNQVAGELGDRTASVAAGELGNILQLADAFCHSLGTESRGAHSRSEYPATGSGLAAAAGSWGAHVSAEVDGPGPHPPMADVKDAVTRALAESI